MLQTSIYTPQTPGMAFTTRACCGEATPWPHHTRAEARPCGRSHKAPLPHPPSRSRFYKYSFLEFLCPFTRCLMLRSSTAVAVTGSWDRDSVAWEAWSTSERLLTRPGGRHRGSELRGSGLHTYGIWKQSPGSHLAFSNSSDTFGCGFPSIFAL